LVADAEISKTNFHGEKIFKDKNLIRDKSYWSGIRIEKDCMRKTASARGCLQLGYTMMIGEV